MNTSSSTHIVVVDEVCWQRMELKRYVAQELKRYVAQVRLQKSPEISFLKKAWIFPLLHFTGYK